MPTGVIDNPARQRFELALEGATAFVSYRRAPDVLTLVHTQVPAELAGRGVGSALARGALELARAQGCKVVPRCPFIAGFVKKHPEFQDLMAAVPPA